MTRHSHKPTIGIVLIAGLFLAAGTSVFSPAQGQDTVPPAPASAETAEPAAKIHLEEMTITTAAGETHPFRLEVALTPDQKRLGLMFRRSMEDDRGMIFPFSAPDMPIMWMKDTYIPLDMLFIREDGTIVGIHPNATPESRDIISAPEPITAVIELKGGIAEKLGITTGDKVTMARYYP